MSAKTGDAKARRASRTPRGDTRSHGQIEGTPRGHSDTRTLEKMPHERDESASDTGNRLDQALPPVGAEIAQAHEDIEAGLEDTDCRGTPDGIPSSLDNRGR